MRKRTLLFATLPTLLILFLTFSRVAQAQNFAEIAGTVTDASNSVVAGAKVTIINQSTNQTHTVTTNESGSYRVPFLVPGIYNVLTEKPAFKKEQRLNYTLQVGAVAEIDFVLQVGQAEEVIEVNGSAPLMERESDSLGVVVENKRVLELPLNGRNYLQMVALSPNVSAEQGSGGFSTGRQGGDRTLQSFAVAGQRLEFNNYTLDGIENTDVNFNTFIIRPSIEALQEFKVLTGIYSAEFGRSTSQISVVTRAGSNSFHADVFEFLRNSALDAKEWRNTGRNNPFKQNQFGYVASGPVLKDRLFFLSNAEFLRANETFQEISNVPTVAMRSGDFSSLSNPIYDPTTRASGIQQFAGNKIPAGQLNPIAQKLLEFYPAPNQSTSGILGNYIFNSPDATNENSYTERVDWTESTKSNWLVRYSWGTENFGEATSFATQPTITDTSVKQLAVSNVRTFSQYLVNEFRFGMSNFYNAENSYYANKRNVAKELGIVGVTTDIPSAWGTPLVTLANGFTGFGQDANGPFVNNNYVFQWLDNVSLTHGKHSFTLGGEVRDDHYNQFGNTFIRPQFYFTGFATANPAVSNTGNSFADFLLGDVQTAVGALGLANIQFRAASFAGYFEDSWKLSRHLVANIGIRYENTPPFHDAGNNMMNLALKSTNLLDPNNVPILTRPGTGDFYRGMQFHYADAVPTQIGDRFLGNSLVSRSNKDFAPRVGLSWSPASNWTIRTGFGIFYVQDTANPVFDMARNLAGRTNYVTDPNSPLSSPLGNPWQAETAAGTCSNWPITNVCTPLPTIFANYQHRRTPYVMQYMLNVQRQLTQTLVLEAGYIGNGGRGLERITNINVPTLPTSASDLSSEHSRAPWQPYGFLQEMGNLVTSNYNGLSGKLQQQFYKGLTYMIGYTWSKSIDNGSAIRTNPGDSYLLPPNPYNIAAERGLSQFNVGQRAVGSVVYQVPNPLADKSALGREIFDGWQAGSIITIGGGNPQSIGPIGDTARTGIAQRPDWAGNPVPSHQTAANFWNVSAFNINPTANGAAPHYGTVGRNTLIGPHFRNWDASLHRDIHLRGESNVEFRWELFNAANHPNWNAPSVDPTNKTTFGVVTSARTMREMQFGLKYMF